MYNTLQVYGVFHFECAVKAMRESTIATGGGTPIITTTRHEYNENVKPTDLCWYCQKPLGGMTSNAE